MFHAIHNLNTYNNKYYNFLASKYAKEYHFCLLKRQQVDAQNELPKWSNSPRLKHHPGRRPDINDTQSDDPAKKPTPNNPWFRYVASQKRCFNWSDNFDIWIERIFALQRRSVAQARLGSTVNRKGYLLVLEVNNQPAQFVRWRLHQSHFPTDLLRK